MSPAFEIVIQTLIIINIVPIALEFAVDETWENSFKWWLWLQVSNSALINEHSQPQICFASKSDHPFFVDNQFHLCRNIHLGDGFEGKKAFSAVCATDLQKNLNGFDESHCPTSLSRSVCSVFVVETSSFELFGQAQKINFQITRVVFHNGIFAGFCRQFTFVSIRG